MDHGFKFTLAPRGDRKRPLKTALQQRADRPCSTRRALRRQISSTSCRRAAACRNLSPKPAVPEIRLSRSPVQRFSGASEGFGCTQPLAGLYGANFGLIRRPAGPATAQFCFSTRNSGPDQRGRSRIQELAPVRHWHPRIADRQAPCLPARLDTESPATLHCFPQRFF